MAGIIPWYFDKSSHLIDLYELFRFGRLKFSLHSLNFCYFNSF
ncbi:hypothetical protein QWZ13_05710 [Reinekea marina]|nr:hypothetical protein [Reinekea marina]MDN3648402.1 hypothetical protein [Reinekea marina]